MFESIKITCTSTNENTSSLLTQIEDLKAQLEGSLKVATRSSVKPKVLAPGMEIVEEAKVVKLLDNALNYACQYTKLSQELLEYVIGTCPKSFNERDNKAPSTPVTRKKQVTFSDKPGTSSSNTQKHERNTVPTATVVNAPIVSINTSVSTTIAQDVPSTSHSLSSSQVHPPVFPQGEPSFCTVNIRDVSLAEPNQVNSTTKIIFSEEGPKITLLNNIVGNPLDNAMSQHYAYAIIRMSGIEKKYYREVLSFLVRIDLLAGHQRSKEASAISINKAEYIAMSGCRGLKSIG
ncbi:hypothetical protein Tco_0780261 [Tanacetum coccineum]